MVKENYFETENKKWFDTPILEITSKSMVDFSFVSKYYTSDITSRSSEFEIKNLNNPTPYILLKSPVNITNAIRQQNFLSSEGFSKEYIFGRMLKNFNFTFVVLDDLNLVGLFYKFSREQGALGLLNKTLLCIQLGPKYFYGWVLNTSYNFVANSNDRITITLGMVGYDE